MCEECVVVKLLEIGYDWMCLGMLKEERVKLLGFIEILVVWMFIFEDVDLEFDDFIWGMVCVFCFDD